MEQFAWLILLMGVAIVAAYFYVKRRQQAPSAADPTTHTDRPASDS